MPRVFFVCIVLSFLSTVNLWGQNFTCTQNGPSVKWRIDRPGVKSARTEYGNIKFLKGDRIAVSAGGCVQTGGSGTTWKRYRDPLPADKYYGTLEIPGVLKPMPLRDVSGSVIVPDNVAETHLVLGYVDDDYSDNGYWSPDRGNPAQCTIPGDAFVEVAIEQGTQSDVCPKVFPKPFDVVLTQDGNDPNGFPVNPKWGAQLASTAAQFPDADACNISGNGNFDPKCTNSSTSVNAPTWLHKAVCNLTTSPAHGKPRAHFNWTPATFVAPVYWGGHQSAPFDGDVDLWITPRENAAVAAGNETTINNLPAMEVEFNMDEVFRRFTRGAVPSWDQIVDAVDQEDNSQGGDPNGPPSRFNNKCAVVVGLLGLDCDHGCKSELHPAFLFALHTKDDPNDDTWLIFARNIGNEGYCSSKLVHLDLAANRISALIPRPGAQFVKMLDTTRFYSVLNDSSLQVEVGPAGNNSTAAVTFEFPQQAPATVLEGDLVFGELHLQWNGAGSATSGDHACNVPTPGLTVIRGAENEETDALRNAFGLKEGSAREHAISREHRFNLALAEQDRLKLLPPELKRGTQLRITAVSAPPAHRAPSTVRLIDDLQQAAEQHREAQELCRDLGTKSAPTVCRQRIP